MTNVTNVKKGPIPPPKFDKKPSTFFRQKWPFLGVEIVKRLRLELGIELEISARKVKIDCPRQLFTD